MGSPLLHAFSLWSGMIPPPLPMLQSYAALTALFPVCTFTSCKKTHTLATELSDSPLFHSLSRKKNYSHSNKELSFPL